MSKETKKTIKVTLVKSPIGAKPKHRATVKGLGFKRLGHTVERENTDCVRGMINAISHLVRVEGV